MFAQALAVGRLFLRLSAHSDALADTSHCLD
jgi:hypothetical protein